ncbi:MAG: ABC transporter permease [Lentisphaeria bacterium]|nr:ABC transporter permease [Lentisphaeria bacterium]
MMNLAFRDIKYNFGRFLLTTAGISLLLMVVMGMGGIYRGLIQEATLIIDRSGADIWVVQRNTKGPFAEVSKLPRQMEYRLEAIDGVDSAEPFVSHTVQRDFQKRVLRLTIQGLPDNGAWLPIIQGRALQNGHYEMLADKSAKLPVGTTLLLGKDTFTVVGITDRMNSPAGDAMVFVSLNDALTIQFDTPAEAIRNERNARLRRFDNSSYGSTSVDHGETLSSESARPAALPEQQISAVLLKVNPAYSVEEIMAKLKTLPDITAYTSQEQRQIMLSGFVARSRKQLLLFRTILITVSTVVMTLILYTLTLDKLHSIAMLKLIGAGNSVIIGMIMQQSLAIGVLAFGIARFFGQWVYPHFPRRVVLVSGDLWLLFGIVIGISILASVAGIIKAMRTNAGEVLS